MQQQARPTRQLSVVTPFFVSYCDAGAARIGKATVRDSIRICDAWHARSRYSESAVEYDVTLKCKTMVGCDNRPGLKNCLSLLNVLQHVVMRDLDVFDSLPVERFSVLEIFLPERVLDLQWVVYVSIAAEKSCVLYMDEINPAVGRDLQQVREEVLVRAKWWIAYCPNRDRHGTPLFASLEGGPLELRRARPKYTQTLLSETVLGSNVNSWRHRIIAPMKPHDSYIVRLVTKVRINNTLVQTHSFSNELTGLIAQNIYPTLLLNARVFRLRINDFSWVEISNPEAHLGFSSVEALSIDSVLQLCFKRNAVDMNRRGSTDERKGTLVRGKTFPRIVVSNEKPAQELPLVIPSQTGISDLERATGLFNAAAVASRMLLSWERPSTLRPASSQMP
jgi:hypothetical protein